MGVFLSGSAVVQRDLSAIRSALSAFLASAGEEYGQLPLDAVTAASVSGNTTVLYPSAFYGWDEASRFLSSSLGASVFSIHVHDGDLWMFVLFRDGERVTAFNPWPDYWQGRISSDELVKWQPDAALVAQATQASNSDDFDRYFVRWDASFFEVNQPRKAYSDDRFTYGSCWQLVDFLQRIGFALPEPPADEPLQVELSPEVQDLVHQRDVSRLRYRAESAWKARDYPAALDLLLQLGEDARPSEQKKIEFCRRRLSGRGGSTKPWWRFWSS